MQHDLFKNIDALEAWAIELQRGLVAIPAITPTSDGTGELDKAVWLEQELRKLPFDTIARYDAPHPSAKGGVRPNLVALYKGTEGGRTLWIMSHLDVVPPGDLSLWKTDPFTLTVKGRTLYGRGVEDNHQGLVASLLAVRAIMESGWRPPFDLGLLFAADEETGSEYGAGFLCRQHAHLFGPRDMFIVPDGGLADGSMVEVAEKSIWWLKIKTQGKQCHASMPQKGINAFRAASELVVALQSLYKTFPKKDPLFDPPMSTFEPTKKENNIPNINTIPAEDVFYLDARVLPCYPLKKVEAEIKRLARAIEKKHKVKISFEDVQRGEAAPPTAADDPLVTELIGAVKEVHKVEAVPRGIGGGTVAAFFRKLHLPAVVYSKLDEVAHQPNEYCKLDNLLGDAKVFALTALRLAERAVSAPAPTPRKPVRGAARPAKAKTKPQASVKAKAAPKAKSQPRDQKRSQTRATRRR